MAAGGSEGGSAVRQSQVIRPAPCMVAREWVNDCNISYCALTLASLLYSEGAPCGAVGSAVFPQ